jgi:hypothetical protein
MIGRHEDFGSKGQEHTQIKFTPERGLSELSEPFPMEAVIM